MIRGAGNFPAVVKAMTEARETFGNAALEARRADVVEFVRQRVKELTGDTRVEQVSLGGFDAKAAAAGERE